MRRSTNTAWRSTGTGSTPICVSSCCGSIRRSAERSSRCKSPMVMRPNTNLTAALGTALLLALSTSAFAAEFARDEVTRTETRSIAIKGTPVLAIDHDNGSLRVKTHAKTAVVMIDGEHRRALDCDAAGFSARDFVARELRRERRCRERQKKSCAECRCEVRVRTHDHWTLAPARAFGASPDRSTAAADADGR